MSTQPSPVHPPPASHIERERLPSGTIVAVGVGSVLLFAAAIGVTTWQLREQVADAKARGMAGLPADLGKPELGIVDQTLFEQNSPGPAMRQQQLDRLSSYGWVDRQKKIIHIPIEQAMERVAAEQKK